MHRLAIALLFLSTLITAADVRTGVYLGRTVTFENVDGTAVYQGDIILGATAELEAAMAAEAGKAKASSVISANSRLWPNGRVPYTIDSTLSAALRQRIDTAIEHWNTRTPLELFPRTNEFNYVRFTTSASTISCSSSVGMVGGAQQIRLPDGCGLGPIIHEIGHAIGLWHEQERGDRNRFITVLYENIDKASAGNYDQAFSSGRDVGSYDFGSIMHYGAFDFSRDGLSPAMETVPAGIPVGQRAGLSQGDLDVVRRIYGDVPTRTTVATTPSGLKVFVDGALVDDGTVFDWAPGSTHTLRAPFQGNESTRYYFGNWSDGGAETHTITTSADTTVYIANFVRQHRVVSATTPAAGGTVGLSPVVADGFYNERSNIGISATPAGGFRFVTWSVTPSRSLNPKTVTVRSPLTINATFTTGPVTTFTSEPIGRTVMVDGSPYSTPVSFAWISGSTHAVDVDTTQPNFIHYTFNGWADEASKQRTVRATAENQTFTAKFTTQQQLLLTSPRNGTIALDPTSTDGFYDIGTRVQLTATPAIGFAFSGWSGDLGGRQSPITLTMDDQKTVAGAFANPNSLPAITAVNAASGQAGAVSAGALVVIYGSNLGPGSLVGTEVAGGIVSKSLAGTQVLFDGQPAPVIYTSGGQVSAVVPYRVAQRTSTVVQILYNNVTTPSVLLPVVEARPAIFTADSTGKNGAAALNSNGTLNTPTNPVRRGDIIAFYATGEGVTAPGGVDGQVANSVYPKPALPVSVRIGGQPAAVHYAGAAPGLVAGVMQINVQVPDGVAAGPAVPIQLVIGSTTSPSGVTIAIQ